MNNNVAYFFYTVLTSVLFVTVLPFFFIYIRITGRYRYNFKQRLGVYPDSVARPSAKTADASFRIWIHAASVGEVQVAEALMAPMKKEFPRATFLLSTVTEKGHRFAQERLGKHCACVLAPVDFIFFVKKAMAEIQPDLFICLETELWPHLLIQAKRSGAKTMVVNGRISVHSIKGYLRVRPFVAAALRHVDGFSMISRADARRIKALGAPAERVRVNGNAKYDLLARKADNNIRVKMKKLFHIAYDEPVWVAGTTGKNEKESLIVFNDRFLSFFRDMVFIVAPRHIERAPAILRMFRERRFSCQLRSAIADSGDRRRQPVVVVDTMGELQRIYSIATFVFCGGSLVNRGGQNPLEAAVWGCPVLHGPSMEDFDDARRLLETAQGGLIVRDGESLYHTIVDLLNHPEKRKKIAAAARQTVLGTQQAADNHVRCIRDCLNAEQ